MPHNAGLLHRGVSTGSARNQYIDAVLVLMLLAVLGLATSTALNFWSYFPASGIGDGAAAGVLLSSIAMIVLASGAQSRRKDRESPPGDEAGERAILDWDHFSRGTRWTLGVLVVYAIVNFFVFGKMMNDLEVPRVDPKSKALAVFEAVAPDAAERIDRRQQLLARAVGGVSMLFFGLAAISLHHARRQAREAEGQVERGGSVRTSPRAWLRPTLQVHSAIGMLMSPVGLFVPPVLLFGVSPRLPAALIPWLGAIAFVVALAGMLILPWAWRRRVPVRCPVCGGAAFVRNLNADDEASLVCNDCGRSTLVYVAGPSRD